MAALFGRTLDVPNHDNPKADWAQTPAIYTVKFEGNISRALRPRAWRRSVACGSGILEFYGYGPAATSGKHAMELSPDCVDRFSELGS
jgi:hypothetical protein